MNLKPILSLTKTGGSLPSVLTNVGFVLIAQSISLLSNVVITRLYSPHSLGEFGTLTACVLIAVPLCSLGLAASICYASTERDAAILREVALVGSTIGGLLVALIGVPVAIGLTWRPIWPILLAVSIFFATLTHVQTQWAFRQRALGVRGAAVILGSSAVAAGKIGAGTFIANGVTLSVAQLANGLVAALVVPFRPYTRLNLGLKRRLATYNVCLRRYRNFWKYYASSQALRYVLAGLPIMLISAMAGKRDAGQYALAVNVVSGPMIILSDAVSDVLRRPIVDAFQISRKRGLDLTRRHSIRLGAIGVIPALSLWFFADPLFRIVFGPAWDLSASLARWLVLWLVLQFAISPIHAALPAVGLQRLQLHIEMWFGTARVLIIPLVLYGTGSVVSAVAGYSVFGLAMASFTIWRFCAIDPQKVALP